MGDGRQPIAGTRGRVAHVGDIREPMTIADREVSVTSYGQELRGYWSLGREGGVRLAERAGVEV